MSNLTAPTPRPRSRLDMPALNTRGAPKKFKGSPHDVVKFLGHMEKLFTQNNVVDNIEKIECMAEYCSRNVVHILEGMANYTTPDWPLLVTAMGTMFDADKDQQRHREYDLKKLTDSWRKTHIRSMTDWRQYLREFTKIAGWLVNHGIIDEDTAARYMWKGLHISLRSLVEDRLLAQDPTRDMSVVFPQDDVIGVINARFRRGRFDAELDESRSDSDDESADSDSDDSTDSQVSDSDDDLPPRKKSKKSKSKGKTKKQAKVKRPATPIAPAPARGPKPPRTAPAVTTSSDEVGDLVKQLSRMNIEDAEYNYLYYRATSLDPHVAKCVRAPALSVKAPPLPPNNFRNNQYTPPADQYGPNPNANVNRPPLQPQDRTCFGCGERGHGLWECAKIAEAMATGEIRRGDRG
ncbi:hypothetical protein C8F04DRAFT_962861, partial [Mycena alexandri]